MIIRAQMKSEREQSENLQSVSKEGREPSASDVSPTRTFFQRFKFFGPYLRPLNTTLAFPCTFSLIVRRYF